MIQDIPFEVFHLIFKHLSDDDLRKNVSLTCRKWHTLVQEFNLIERKVILGYPFDDCCTKILNDFNTYSSFGPRVKIINVVYKEIISFSFYNYYDDEDEDEDEDENYIDNTDKFNLLMKVCNNVEELHLWTNEERFFANILSNILSPQQQYESKLTILELDCSEARVINGNYIVEMDISKLICESIPSLQELIVYTPLLFLKSNIHASNQCSLRKLKTVCPKAGMTKDCLNYLLSGQLVHLEEFDLFLTLKYTDKNKEIYMEEDVTLFNKVSNFCLTKMKKYNVTLLDSEGLELLSIDNCENEEEKHPKYDDNESTLFVNEGSGF